MKYWQLTSIMRGRHAAIRRVAERKAEWRFVAAWLSADNQIVQAQDREKLDYVLDDSFVRAVLRKCPLRFFLTRNHQLCSQRRSRLDEPLSALRAFDLYGAMALEDAKEYGSVGVAYSGGPSAPRPATQPVAAPASDGKRQYSEPVEAELTLPETIDGIVASKSRTGVEIQVGAGTSEAFFRLLLWLPYGYELGFYDQYRNNSGGEDDPGVFVSITRKGASFVYMAGNHGWSSDWVFQSPEVLAAWMALNLKPAGARPSPLKTIDVRRLWTPPFERW